MTDIKVRPYTKSDLARIVELAKELDRELAARVGRKPKPDVSERFYRGKYLDPKGYYTVLVAVAANSLDGYIIGSSSTGRPEIGMYGPQEPSRASSTEINIVFTTADSRQRGFGKAMVKSLADYVRENYRHREIGGFVAKWNEPSAALFRSLGFDEEVQDTRSWFSQKL
jgi:L-amino acid N-acyltransferase YncA